MAWTFPKTWFAGELLTADLLNTHLRDNLHALHARPKASYANASMNWTTTSTAWVAVNAATDLSLTTEGGRGLAMVVAGLTWTGGSSWGDRMFMRVLCDGVAFGVSPRVTRYGNDGNYFIYTLMALTEELTIWTHDFTLQWLVGGTVGLGIQLNTLTFIVQEIG